MQRIRGVGGPIVGHYRVAALTGLTTGVAAGGAIFSARWATAAYLRAAILRLKVKALTVTAFTTAQELQIAAFLASAFTASDTGGTALVPVAGQNSLIQVVEASQASQFTDIRVASSTTALGNGTRTLDTNPFLADIGFSTSLIPLLADYDVSSDQRMPIILQGTTPTIGQQGIPGVQPPPTPAAIAANAQGIVVVNNLLQGAAGTVRFLVEMEWVEYATNAAEAIS